MRAEINSGAGLDQVDLALKGLATGGVFIGGGIAPKLRAELIDEMSFMFRITAGHWSPDYTEFRINAVDINRGDVSAVNFGANPTTSVGVEGKREESAPVDLRAALLDVYLAD